VIAVSKTLAELASEVGGKVIGDGELVIRSVASIEEAGPGQIAFLANPRYRPHLALSRAGAVIVGFGVIKDGTIDRLGKNYLEVADPYLAFAKILTIFAPSISYNRKVNASAHVDPTAILGEDVTLFANAFVGPRSQVGARSVLYPGVYIGDDVQIGAGCILHSNVVVRDGCRIGDRVIIHPGAVIGSDGFGFAGEGDHRAKIPQSGIVEIHDNVEIGANTTVDRATLGKTIIGRGTKIDNLVQIAHNVSIGRHCLFAGQVGISGSTTVEDGVIMGGQVGVTDHLTIGAGAMLGAKSGVFTDVPPGGRWSGYPARSAKQWLREVVTLEQLARENRGGRARDDE
jgi:UDP-3-O-[3-hydroxymyristoyl] glucosamine N-acyltransferase